METLNVTTDPILLGESDDEHNSHPPSDSKKKGSNSTAVTKPGKNFKRQRRLTSDVWAFFEFLDQPDE